MGGPGDLGADLLGSDQQGRPVVVQCKRYAGRVGSPVVQAVIGAAVIHQARPVLVCSDGFTAAAVSLGRSQGVELVDGETLACWAATAGTGRAWAARAEGVGGMRSSEGR